MKINKRQLLTGTFMSFGLSTFALSRMGEPNFTGIDSEDATVSLASNGHIVADGWRMRVWQTTNDRSPIKLDRSWGTQPARVSMIIKGPGWDANGNYLPFAERVVLAAGFVRSMWKLGVSEHSHPDTAPIEVDRSPAGLWSDVTLVRQIYRGELCSARLEPGWSWTGAREQTISLSNRSQLHYEKTMIDWLEPVRAQKLSNFSVRMTGGVHIEARNGRPLACLKIRAIPWNMALDQLDIDFPIITKNAVYRWSGDRNSPGLGSAVWEADFDISEMRVGLYKFEFDDCPWVGDHSAKRASEILSGPDPRFASLMLEGDLSTGRMLQPLVWWIGPYPTERHVYVAALDNNVGVLGSDMTGLVASTIEAARSRPFATFNAAWLALFDTNQGGCSDGSACTLWLSDGTHRLPLGGAARIIDSHASIAPASIKSDRSIGANSTNCFIVSDGAPYNLCHPFAGPRTSFILVDGITLRRGSASSGFFRGRTQISPTVIHLSACATIDHSSTKQNFFSNGIVSSLRDCHIKDAVIFSRANSSHYTTFIHNCSSYDSTRSNVVWGIKYTNPNLNSAVFFGSGSSRLLRDRNLLLGYAWCENWATTRTAFFINLDFPNFLVSDIGISVCFVRVPGATQSTRFIRLGENINKSYKNIVIEGISLRRPYISDGGRIESNGFSIQNDPFTIPTSPPGVAYLSASIRMNDIVRLAMKGDVFHARNNNGSPAPLTAHLLTGGREMRNGSNFFANIVGSLNPSFGPNINGYKNLIGRQQQEYIPYYRDPQNLDYAMRGGYVPIEAELIGFGFDINGNEMRLDNNDSPGAFRSSGESHIF